VEAAQHYTELNRPFGKSTTDKHRDVTTNTEIDAAIERTKLLDGERLPGRSSTTIGSTCSLSSLLMAVGWCSPKVPGTKVLDDRAAGSKVLDKESGLIRHDGKKIGRPRKRSRRPCEIVAA